ncbi:MAG TPA: YncE family protein, partial [Actinomycetales bacterium]|nr:YncE family protein [Actinomycetales bacterium]
RLRLSLRKVVTGGITPKSVVASGRGLVVAQNMIYRHTVTAYDARSLSLAKTIKDTVVPAKYGFPKYPKPVRGGPVEAAFSPDGRSLYVSNYSMYGSGFPRPGDDACSPAQHRDDSFVYRIDVASLRITQLIRVGAVPKFLAVSPDGRRLLVSNWCSYSVSVVDTATGKQIRQVGVGRYPRGIAVSPDSRYGYVAVMGSDRVARLDLSSLDVDYLKGVGSGPRHLLLSPEGRFLYATLNGDGRIAKLDLSTGRTVDRVHTGQQPRTMTMAPDGRTLYVVNYASSTVSAVRTSDLTVVQTVPTAVHPIGISYDTGTNQVWVACYRGELMVFRVR